MGQFDWCPVHPTDRVPERVSCRTDIRRLAHGGQRRHPGVTFRWLILNAESVNRRRSFPSRKADGEGWHCGLQRDRPQKCPSGVLLRGVHRPAAEHDDEPVSGEHRRGVRGGVPFPGLCEHLVPALLRDLHGPHGQGGRHLRQEEDVPARGRAHSRCVVLLAAFSPSFWFLIGCRG